MNWNLLWTILSSSITAAFLTKGLDIYSAKISYKRDYYKRVIEERLKIYNQLNDVLYLTSQTVKNGKEIWFRVFNDYQSFSEFILSLDRVSRARIWMSEPLSKAVNKLITLVDHPTKARDFGPQTLDVEYIKLGCFLHVEFNKLHQEIEFQMTIDLSEMYNVSEFFKKQLIYSKPD